MEVKVIRSLRRRSTVSARVVENTLLVRAPLAISEERLEKIISGFREKFAKKKIKEDLERKHGLSEAVARINRKYFDNKLKVNSVEYVTVQNCKFACCNYRSAQIRISHKVGLMPRWVRDYVLVHEMAHLIVPDHSRAFWDIVSRYKFSERARGYLMAAANFSDIIVRDSAR
jgi:predicted metal-dependent hydrolase